MPTVFDSEIFRDYFGTAAMRQVFSDGNVVQQWLNAEVALAEAEAEVGLIPIDAAQRIKSQAKAELISLDQLRTRYGVVGYPILPMLEVWEHSLGEETARWVHWGATTQDITDTGLVLQAKQAIVLLEKDLSELRGILGPLALLHRDTVMAGRTHGQHAVPITFGFKVAIWLAELDRHAQRLGELKPRLLVGQLSGAAGTLASLGDKGTAVQKAMMKGLGLEVPVISWHTARDGFAEMVSWTAILGSTLERIAHEVELLQKTEVAELSESHESGKGASSTMPQKRNPATAEAIIALGKLLRQQVPVAMDSMTQEHERDWWGIHIEWKSLPEACLLCSAALDMTLRMIKGLQVSPKNMAHNLSKSLGLIMAEAVMMKLSPVLGRSQAHKLLYAASMKATEESCSLESALAALPEVTSVLSDSEIQQLLGPQNYLGAVSQWVEIVASAGRKL